MKERTMAEIIVDTLNVRGYINGRHLAEQIVLAREDGAVWVAADEMDLAIYADGSSITFFEDAMRVTRWFANGIETGKHFLSLCGPDSDEARNIVWDGIKYEWNGVKTMAQRAMDRYTVGGHADGQWWARFIARDGYDATATGIADDSDDIALYTDGSSLTFWGEDDEMKCIANPIQIGVSVGKSSISNYVNNIVWNGKSWEV